MIVSEVEISYSFTILIDNVIYSLDRAQTYKDFWTSYMSFALLLAKIRIMVFCRGQRKLNLEAFYLDKD